MRRVRCLARTMILASLFGASLTVSAAGWVIMTAGLETFLLDAGKILGGIFVVVMGLFGVAKGYNSLFLEPQFAAMEERQRRLIDAGLALLEKSFDRLIEHHTDASDPHPKASERMHAPLRENYEKILAIVEELRERQLSGERKLDRLVRAHKVAMSAQNAAIDAIACLGHRNPKASPYPSRATDPEGSGFTAQRGHKADDETILEEDEG